MQERRGSPGYPDASLHAAGRRLSQPSRIELCGWREPSREDLTEVGIWSWVQIAARSQETRELRWHWGLRPDPHDGSGLEARPGE